MFLGYFTERPYQDPGSLWWGATGRASRTSIPATASTTPGLGAELYNRYLDEKVYAEEMGFDAMRSTSITRTPFCMGGVMQRRGGDPRAR